MKTNNYMATMKQIIAGICMLGFFAGCGQEPPPPPKPKIVISKKVPPLPPETESEPAQPSGVPDALAARTIPAPDVSPSAPAKPPADAKPEPSVQAATTTTTVPAAQPAPEKTETVVATAPPAVQPQSEPAVKPELPPQKPESPAQVKPDPEPKPDTPVSGQPDSKTSDQQLTAMAQGIASSDRTAGYNPQGKLDPFAPLFKDEPVREVKQEEEVPGSKEERVRRERRTPLEKVDLSQLKLVGIVRAPSGNRALVEESSGKGYIITQGTYIGIHYGKVTDILPDRVIVEEEDEDFLGRISMRKRELVIQKPPGEEYHDL